MPDLDGQGFDNFFQALWQKPPFAWQQALAERVLHRDIDPWPEAIALPTAAGKTACIDIAVYALASQANRVNENQTLSASRRIFFVVDRRVIVDEAFERAKCLARKLEKAKEGILKEVADRLRQLAGSNNARPLACFQLRGGMYRSDAWARSPTQPMIVASTVDQFGSRLLFRAYGRSSKAWPIQAGLTGNDSLVLLDEAHCAQPFMETLRAVKQYKGWAEPVLLTPFHAVIMSATPPEGLIDVFHDQSDEPKNPEHPLGKRQLATKPAKLTIASKARGAKANEELANALVQQAESIASAFTKADPENAPAVVIFCNRVDTARHAHRLLAKKYDERALLFTGRMRPIDKDDIVSSQLALFAAEDAEARSLPEPLFVVATQTLEVGANLDFDCLVTECASLDALRQRFGRLNRMGRNIQAHAAILIRADQIDNTDDDPVYGSALAGSWQWLKDHCDESETIDFGIAKLASILPIGDKLTKLNPPIRHAPVMLPAHVDVLAQTSPEPWPSPEVTLFLHGPSSGAGDVQVCWRADLTGEDENAWKEAVTLCPPASPECLPVPIGQMRRWLKNKDSAAGADVEGADDKPESETRSDKDDRAKKSNHVVIRWRGRDEVDCIDKPGDLRPGDVVVIPAHLRGWEQLATLGSDPVADWGDRAYAQARDKAVLRLHSEVLRQYPESTALASIRKLIDTDPNQFEDDPQALVDELRQMLSAWADEPNTACWLQPLVVSLATDRKLGKGILPHPCGGLVLRGSHRLNLQSLYVDSFSDENDVASSGTVRSLLFEHLSGVSNYAQRFARACGLSPEIVEIIVKAGLGHDLGKADPRFQAWLADGNPWVRGPLLAKSGNMNRGRGASDVARERAGYPEGGRHELLSVRLMESAPELLPPDGIQRDLLLHLVESHHGFCRPFAPVIFDEAPVDVPLEFQEQKLSSNSITGLERLDAGPAERYWRLTRHYGWWGLAWLESILRLADHRRSEWEERNVRGDAND